MLPTLAGAQTAAPVRVNAPVREVTLFHDNGAELRHDVTVALPVGTTTVRITGLANAFDPTSLQVEVGRAAELLSTEIVAANRTTAADTVSRLRAAQTRAQADQTAIEEEKALLTANRELKGVTAATWNAEVGRVAAAYRDRIRDVTMRLSAATAERQRIDALLSSLTNEASVRSGQATYDVLLRVRLRTAGSVPLTVSYRATSANTGWRPLLALRATTLAQPLQAVSTANVNNGTGVSWTNVRLTLVNASASGSIERPNLQPWTLRTLVKADGTRGLDRTDDDEAVGEGLIDGFSTKGNNTGTTVAAVTDSLRVAGPLSDRFRLAGRVTIPASIATPVSIETLALPMRAEYYVVPKLEHEVYLVAKVSGWQALRAPAESASVYLGGNYVGTTDLNSRAFNDTLEVALGADPQIVVSRTKRADRNSRRLLGSTQRTALAYEINLRNDRSTPIRILVADQIPVSLEKDVVVTATELSGANLDPNSGRLTWLVNLKPGESRRLPFSFAVEAPADQTINLEYRARVMRSPKFR